MISDIEVIFPWYFDYVLIGTGLVSLALLIVSILITMKVTAYINESLRNKFHKKKILKNFFSSILIILALVIWWQSFNYAWRIINTYPNKYCIAGLRLESEVDYLLNRLMTSCELGSETYKSCMKEQESLMNEREKRLWDKYGWLGYSVDNMCVWEADYNDW